MNLQTPKLSRLFFFLTVLLTNVLILISCTKDEENLDTGILSDNYHALSVTKKTPTAIATASKTSGVAPIVVKFNSKSTDDKGITSYSWNFGKGITPTTVRNPSRTLKNPGTYNIKLTVKDSDGNVDSDTITVVVKDENGDEDEDTNTPGSPTSKIIASTTKGIAPLVIKFNSQSTDDKGIVGYSWDFGNGITPTTVRNPSRTFKNPGVYNIKLTVKDADGNKDTENLTITLTDKNGDLDTGTSTDDTNQPVIPTNTNNYPSGAVLASSFGYNSSDATDAFSKAIKSGANYIVIDKQSSDWIIKPTKFFDLKNITIAFEPGVILRAKSGSFTSSSQLLQLVRAQNVVIEGNGATFKMNNGQGKHAVALYNCKGITIKSLILRESGGDGLYIAGDGDTGSYSSNINIENVTATNNTRHGLTIISAQDVWIINSNFLRSSGSTTEVGVDLEPNNYRDRLVNINFNNCTFAYNDSSGFVLGTRSLKSSSTPISVYVKDCEFKSNDLSPSSTRPRTQLQLSQGSHNDPVRGEIRFERVKFNDSKNKLIFTKLSAISYKVLFVDCSAKVLSSNGNDPLIELQSLSVAKTMGGFIFDNFHMEYNSDVPFMKLQVPHNDIVKDITGTFTIDEPNDNSLYVTGGYNTSKNQNVSINYKHIN